MKSITMSSRYSVVIHCLLGLLLALGCEEVAPKSRPKSTPKVTVAKPLVMPIVEWDEYTGRLVAIDSVEVRSRVSGYLQSTHFEEGQLVKKGDLLAIVDPRPFQAELNASKARFQEAQAKEMEAESLLKQVYAEKAEANAQLTLAKQRYNRAKQLSSDAIASKEDVEIRESELLQATAAIEAANAKVESAKAAIATAKAAIETARANVESATLNLQYTQIRSPISGRTSRRYTTEGNLISGGTNQSTLITTIVTNNPIHCYFDANQQQYLKYVRLSNKGKRASSRNVRNPVYVALVDERGFPHQGHMDFVDNQIDAATATMRGRAILENNDALLTPGLFVKLRLPGSGRYEAVLIPDSAVGSDQSEKFVYVVDNESVIQRRVIQLGPISNGLRIIRSGLDGSEKIVIRGLQRVFSGDKVEAFEEQIQASPGELPNHYEPVPKEKWLSRQPSATPAGVEFNNSGEKE